MKRLHIPAYSLQIVLDLKVQMWFQLTGDIQGALLDTSNFNSSSEFAAGQNGRVLNRSNSGSNRTYEKMSLVK